MNVLNVSFLVAVHRLVFGADYGNSAEKRCLKRNAKLTIMLNIDVEATQVDNTLICGLSDDAFSTL